MPFAPENPVVWTEIYVSDLTKAVKFYNDVFDFDMKIITDMGPKPMAVFPSSDLTKSVSCNLVEGTPGGASVIHIAIPDTVEAAGARARKAGGRVEDGVVEIPPGRYAYANDPDGNRIGLFEAKG